VNASSFLPSQVVANQFYLVRRIQKHLNYHDLARSSQVSRLWLNASKITKADKERRFGAWFGWRSSALPQLHKYYELCGNNFLGQHVEAGLLSDLKKWLITLNHRPHLMLAFGTGAAYIYYLLTKSAQFVLQDEVDAFLKLQNLFPSESTSLLMTSLRVINPFTSLSNSTLDFSLLCLPRPLENSNIMQFIISDIQLMEMQAQLWTRDPLKTFDEVNIKIFESVTHTKIDEIKGLIVFNTGDFATIVKSVMKESDKFPILLAESEGLTCLASKYSNSKLSSVTPSSFHMFSSHTTGLIFSGANIDVSSVVLDTNIVTASLIKKKLKLLGRDEKKASFAIMITTCMRGYDGLDINREHVEMRNKLQQLEVSIFKELFPESVLVAVQVEDVLGLTVTRKNVAVPNQHFNYFTNHEMGEDVGNETDISDFSDSSTVFVKIDYL